jgi:hypothetical protein
MRVDLRIRNTDTKPTTPFTPKTNNLKKLRISNSDNCNKLWIKHLKIGVPDLPVNWAQVLWLSQILVISMNEEERGRPLIYATLVRDYPWVCQKGLPSPGCLQLRWTLNSETRFHIEKVAFSRWRGDGRGINVKSSAQIRYFLRLQLRKYPCGVDLEKSTMLWTYYSFL